MDRSRHAVRIWGACVSHRHGSDHYLDGSEEGLYAQLAGYVESWWEDWFGSSEDDDHVPMPADPVDAVQLYFSVAGDADKGEWLDIYNEIVVLPWEGDS